jgi:hypothetical protein
MDLHFRSAAAYIAVRHCLSTYLRNMAIVHKLLNMQADALDRPDRNGHCRSTNVLPLDSCQMDSYRK